MADNVKAVSMLGTSVANIPVKDNGFPGPANYNQIQQASIPSFVIAQNKSKSIKPDDKKN